MKEMEGVCGIVLLLVTLLEGIHGQVITPLSVDVAVDEGTSLVCTTSATSVSFAWIHVTTSITVYSGGIKFAPAGTYENFDLNEDTAAKTSTLIINNIQLRDRGEYRCTVAQQPIEPSATVNVEVEHTLSLDVPNPLLNGGMYNATCDARNGRPDVTITWILGNSGTPCDNTVNTSLTAPTDLFSKRSVCTFQADSENNGETLRCIISGHQVDGLNGEETTTLNIESAPASTGIMTVVFQSQDSYLRVLCDIADAADQPNPSIMNYYITSNDTLIHQSSTGVSFVNVTEPNYATDFVCVAGNYLGNTTSPVKTYDPSGTTTPPPTTAPITSPRPNDGNGTAGLSEKGGIGGGAIAGIVIGAILFVVIIVVIIYFALCRGKDRTDGGKHGSSTVGTSNGGEKDKIKPVAAPRDQGSIQHTTDNPGQQEYAMVDRKKPPGGGDMPDTRGPGQESPGMHYADLDLSTNAGHTERQVPQNPDNVVVYSSILV